MKKEEVILLQDKVAWLVESGELSPKRGIALLMSYTKDSEEGRKDTLRYLEWRLKEVSAP